mgnify:CR=1 FL=1
MRKKERNVTFITGLPRSRNTWLATYAMAHGATVIHEPIRFCDPEHLLNVFTYDPIIFSGYDLIRHYDILRDQGKWVIIQRDMDEVLHSMQDVFEDNINLVMECQEGMTNATLDGHMFFDYNDLDDLETMEQVHAYIFNGAPKFSLRKFLTLKDLKIEPHVEKYIETTSNIRDFFDK